MNLVGAMYFVVFVLLLLFQPVATEVTSNQQCSGFTTIGTQFAFSAATSGPDSLKAFSFMVESPSYVFTCCGVITQWEVKVANPGTIQFHVWRRTSTNVYELIGENAFAIASAGDHMLTVDNAASRIIVQKGDYVGWHSQGDDMVMYQDTHFNSSTLDNFFRRINAGDMLPGDTYDWSTVGAYNDRDYALKVTTIPSLDPIIFPAAASLSVPDSLVKGIPVTSFDYSDLDTAENASLTVYQKESSTLFNVDIPSGKVTANNYYRPQGTTTLKYFAYDQCYHTAEASQTITIDQTNLVIDNLDADFTVAESSTAQTLLHTLTATDPTDQWYCYSGWPPGDPFMLKALSTTSYGFYLTEHPGLSYEVTPSYMSLTVTCRENRVSDFQEYTGNYNVYVTKNYPPTITNLDASANVDAETAVKGDTVFSVTASDTESDVVEFTATCTGLQDAMATCPFTMMKNGNVQVNTNLLFDTNSQYQLVVTATDSDTNTDSGNLIISIANQDNPISIIAYPAAGLQIQENQALGTSLYTFAYEDLDRADAKSWSIFYTDTRLTRHFSLEPDTGLLSLAYHILDYEEIGSATHTATVLVGDVKSTATATFDISIINENEAPRFEQDTYHIEHDEDADGTQIMNGTSLFVVIDVDTPDTTEFPLDCDSSTTTQRFYMTLATGAIVYKGDMDLKTNNDGTQITDGTSVFVVNDVDTPDTTEFSLDCDSSTTTQRFYMTLATGAIVYKGDMDLDTTGTPTDYACTVTVSDSAGLSDTTSLFIHILNVNEDSPEFTKANYDIYLAENTLVGTSVLQVSAIDLDSSDDDDNRFIYTLDDSNFAGGPLFAINHVGVIYTAKVMTGVSTNTFLAKAANTGVYTGTTTITVNILTTTTTAAATTTEERDLGFYEDKWTYYWLLLTLGGLVCIIFAISLVCFRICRLTRIAPWCYNCCRRGWCCRESPPKPRGFGNQGYDLASFGHRHVYVDEDDEIDGWLRRTRRTGQGYKSDRPTSGGPVPMIVGSDGRLSSATGVYEDEQKMPLHELRRVNTPGGVPRPAGYVDPIQQKAIKPKWKGTHRNRGSILKNNPSSWNM